MIWLGGSGTAPDGTLWVIRMDMDSGVRHLVHLEANGALAAGASDWEGFSKVFGFDGQGRAYCQLDPPGGIVIRIRSARRPRSIPGGWHP